MPNHQYFEKCQANCRLRTRKQNAGYVHYLTLKLTGLGRDGHSEQTRFAVERPFRLLKAEKNESKQYI